MPLSWNEIKGRAVAFSKEWELDSNEDAEAKSFWDAFFEVFGVPRRRVATFEQVAKKADDTNGYIDLLWRGRLLIEHKSRGKDLDKAYRQALGYFPGLKDKELPRYVLVSDFARFRLYDLDSDIQVEFPLEELIDHVHEFGFIAGYEKRTYKEQDPVNIEAAELMGKLHDKLKEIGYEGHSLELYLVRLLFCLFADDTNIFEKGIFHDFIRIRTGEDGSDLGAHLSRIFQILNTPEDRRQKVLDESLAALPYVNGKLFEEPLPFAEFDSQMRTILLDCCLLDWGKISPAIFGSLFQSVMDTTARRNLGAHYTSEQNILKLIKPLFLDELWTEFNRTKKDKNKLRLLHQKISKFKFLDPACGCGNFLIVAYRELRLLELEIIKAQFDTNRQLIVNLSDYFLVDVDQFYGIEYEEFPSQIAQVAMWLMDHQMNEIASLQFGEYYKRIPLKKSATIVHGNALQVEWQSIIRTTEEKFHFILGNPPFVGKQYQDVQQKKDMLAVFGNAGSFGALDYVTAWYLKAARYLDVFNRIIDQPPTIVGFVSTNSITQGEQVAILWGELLTRYHITIHFAHRTFKWGNEASANAAVHVVIIGFSNFNVSTKQLFEYEDIAGQPHSVTVGNINPYLVAGRDVLVSRRKTPLTNVPQLVKGNQPTDDGNYLFTPAEKEQFLSEEPGAAPWMRRFIGASEFINNTERWCLWLKDTPASELRRLPKVIERVNNVRVFRLKSKKAATVGKAETPALFDEIRHTGEDYLVIPETSSERRTYIPIGYIHRDVISSNAIYMLPNANYWLFGVLNSMMHNTWTKTIAGRLKSDFRYSNGIIYNNFPWPLEPTPAQKSAVEKAAEELLAARQMFPGQSLADLYDPLTMPLHLLKAHQKLDRAVDLCYRPQPFPSYAKRIEYLFDLYDNYIAGLFASSRPGRRSRS